MKRSVKKQKSDPIITIQKEIEKNRTKLGRTLMQHVAKARTLLQRLKTKKRIAKKKQNECKHKCQQAKQKNKKKPSKQSLRAIKKATLAYDMAANKVNQLQTELVQTKKMLDKYHQELKKFKSETKALKLFEKSWRQKVKTESKQQMSEKAPKKNKPVSPNKALAPRVIILGDDNK